MYFDDVMDHYNHRDAGELLAIEEFNERNGGITIDQWRGLRPWRPFPDAIWLDGMYVAHDLAAISQARLTRAAARMRYEAALIGPPPPDGRMRRAPGHRQQLFAQTLLIRDDLCQTGVGCGRRCATRTRSPSPRPLLRNETLPSWLSLPTSYGQRGRCLRLAGSVESAQYAARWLSLAAQHAVIPLLMAAFERGQQVSFVDTMFSLPDWLVELGQCSP